MHLRKFIALAMVFLIASLMLPTNVIISRAQSGSNAPTVWILALAAENMVEVSFAASDEDENAQLSCEYFVETAVMATRHEVACNNNEIVRFSVPIVTQDSGIEGCIENTNCRIIVRVEDETGKTAEGEAEVLAGTPDWTNDQGGNGDDGNGNSGADRVSIRDLNAESTGRLSFAADAFAASGVKYIDIYYGYQAPGQNPTNPVKKWRCEPPASTPSYGCEKHDSNTYQEGTVVTYYAKMKPVSGNEIESEHHEIIIQNSIAGEVGNNVQCYQSCSRSTGSSVPVGYCSADGKIPPEYSSQMNSLGLVRGPFKNSQASCPVGEYCWCIYIDYKNGFDQIAGSCRHDSLIVARAPQVWNDPSRLDPAPRKTVSPAPYACDAATKATVVADVSQSRIESGTMLSVEGAVGRIADKCNGYEYTCRNQRVLQCDVDEGFFRTKLKYENCPDGYERIYAKGKKTIINWGTILGLAAVLCSLGTTIAGSAKKGGDGKIGGVGPDGQLPPPSDPTGTPYEPGPLITEGPDENLGRQIILNSIAARTVGDDSNKITGMVPPLIIVMAICTALQGAKQIYCGLPPRQPPACYSVCAKDTASDAAPTYESVCRSAGTTYVIAADDALYSCTPSRAGVCGGFPNKEVNIKIRNAAGDLSQETNLFTDADGAFEFTFRAPFTEGRYNAVVTVPGGV